MPIREVDASRISRSAFTPRTHPIKLHGHCHQKVLSSIAAMARMLELPEGQKVTVIPSGCCGMAGSFGYEEEHFDLSQHIPDAIGACSIVDGAGLVRNTKVRDLGEPLVTPTW